MGALAMRYIRERSWMSWTKRARYVRIMPRSGSRPTCTAITELMAARSCKRRMSIANNYMAKRPSLEFSFMRIAVMI
eukprot:2796658-Prymnesium_polylepis.1